MVVFCNMFGLFVIRKGLLLPVRQFCSTCRGHRVKSLLLGKPVDQVIQVNGWIKGIRRQKERTFLDLDDGSCTRKLQVVLASETLPASVGFHSAVAVSGVLQLSSHPAQEVELLAAQVQVLSEPMKEEYPFKARKIHTADYIRQFLHLRPRTNIFSSLLRVRSQTKLAMQNYFAKEGFVNIDTPILTANDCEGGGEVFTVECGASQLRTEDNSNNSPKYFGVQTHLTVSGQLHLEAAASGMSKVYNFNPAFRAENSQTRRHLAEFWMVEGEEAFLQGTSGAEQLLHRIEALIKHSIQSVLEHQPEDMSLHWQKTSNTEAIVTRALQTRFVHLPYCEAIKMLQDHRHKLQVPAVFGQDLLREHELFLTEHMGSVPVFVTEWPSHTKPFYMCSHDNDPDKVLAVDLLLPKVGEVAGGGLREHRSAHLRQQLEKRHLLHKLGWYLDLRQLGGGVPSGGFGVGFERLLQFMLGIANIKDTIPFPRWSKHCPC